MANHFGLVKNWLADSRGCHGPKYICIYTAKPQNWPVQVLKMERVAPLNPF